MDHDSLIQLLPQLLNKGAVKPASSDPKHTQQSNNWYEEQASSDRTSNQTQSDTDQSSETASSDEDESEESEQQAKQQERLSPKPVDLDEIEKFLDGISRTTTPRLTQGRPRDMVNILREVDELGRRTLSSSSLPDRDGAGRPPPSPRRPPEARSPATPVPASGAASESALLKEGESANRRVRFSRTQKAVDRDEPTSLVPRSGGGGKLSVSEPALGYTLQSLMSEERKKYLNLTADMILLKQSSLESEIQMKTQWEEHVRDLMAENSSLKLQLEELRSRPSPDLRGSLSERSRVKNLEHRVEEQNRLLDGFNAENARLYRELQQLKTERADLETVVDDLQCEQRLLRAQLQAAQRAAPAAAPAAGEQRHQEQQLRRRELELEHRWQEVQRAGNEVARLHELVAQRQAAPCARCSSTVTAGAPRQSERTARPPVATVSCQTVAPTSPTRSPAVSPARPPTRSPEHVAAAATAELRSLRAALVQAEQRLDQETQASSIREADLRRACDAKVRAAEGRLRRMQASSSPSRHDPELMAALRRLKAQLADKERALTQSRRQLEKSQRTVTGLQREREKLLVSVAAARSPAEPRSRRSSPSRSQRASPSRRASVASAAAEGRCVDETLLSELQTAIAAVEEENVHLKDQLGQMKVYMEEEVSRRDCQIAALRRENDELRAKLAVLPSPSPSAAVSEEDAVLSARKDSLMLEMGSHMEAQEHVIVHLRETIRRFQEQTRLIAGLEEENRALRGTIETLNWRTDSAGGRQLSPDAAQDSNRTWAS
ncbi:ciliary rootlet coiled-coil protein 2-like [Amphibalanus amphitrite]|uniref:ciliary rootlet coiled-coil protein 2-like n=1 Tax=Amphibalanus amphitrite TaxID=1232801 RepID=UPI001C9216DD|nr:ciliary rootlet coiled-coil protein 2-like [Amphibalanus amphitrite]XP_043235109.1 ciliary rootlet coiled-coil protein 2-like [Amphibalanus amphitrite]XP_043235111.1 ciliary rootlet coiled-coil protein 2-like [Amphibalanus amphitrite]XP_043235112.1 ciliary rootlet coiled-coil protein 2-like [Amphibalanus amphitrite]XP_043235113.1 ciliary rootlet coiled-coil protein 2-like [Amphibalanus amphitrite]XP_043235114.1 ciliary rootlet coiled-coil protein 2-like [Amphibalanus amphitrite]